MTHNSLTVIHDALATALRTIPNLNVYGYVPEQPSPPAAWITFVSRDWQSFGRGVIADEFHISVIVGRLNDRESQRQLLSFAETDGPNSVLAAIETDMTLGLSNMNAVVSGVENFSHESGAGMTWVGIRIPLSVSHRRVTA